MVTSGIGSFARHSLVVSLVSLLATQAGTSSAMDAAIRLGEGNRVRNIAADLAWPIARSLPCSQGCDASAHLQGLGAFWWVAYDDPGVRSMWDLGLSPALRIRGSSGTGPILEIGIGAHYLSRADFGPDRAFGSHWQFGEFLSFGFPLEREGQRILSLRIDHISNGGAAAPNTGVTFIGLCLRFSVE